MPDTATTDQYGADLMQSAISPILADDVSPPEQVLQQLYDVYDKGQGKWSKDAKDLYSKAVDGFSRASNIQFDTSPLAQYSPPTPDPKKPDEDNLKAVDAWQSGLKSEFEKNSDGDWQAARGQYEPIIDHQALEAKRAISGKNKSLIGDLTNRVINSGVGFTANTLGTDAPEYYEKYLSTNPKYDERWWTKPAEIAGQLSAGTAIPAVAGAVTGIFATPAVGAFTFAGLAAVMNGSAAYNSAYNRTYATTGSSQLAHRAALEQGIFEGGVTTLVQGMVAKKVLEPWVLGLSEERQAMAVARVLANTTMPIVSKGGGKAANVAALAEDIDALSAYSTAAAVGEASPELQASAALTMANEAIPSVLGRAATSVLKAGAVGGPSQAVGSAAMEINRQYLDSAYSGQPLNAEAVAMEGLIGGVTGFAVSGAVGAVSGAWQALSSRHKARILENLAKDGQTLSEDGFTVVDENNNPVSNINLAMDRDFQEMSKTPENEDPTGLPKEEWETPKVKGKILNEKEQENLATKLENFVDSPASPSELTLEGVAEESIPDKLVAHLDLKKEVTPTGVTLKKVPLVEDSIKATIIPTETEQKVTPTAEEIRRILQFPKQIAALSTELKSLPTKQKLEQSRKTLPTFIAKLQRELNMMKRKGLSPTQIASADTFLRIQRAKLAENEFFLENYDETIIKKGERLKSRINDLQLEYDTANNFVNRTTPVNPFEEPPSTEVPSKSLKVKGVNDKLSTVEGTADMLKPIMQSRTTGATFTSRISNSLRNALNYWIAGMDMKNIHVTTFDEANSPTLNKFVSPEHRKLMRLILNGDERRGIKPLGATPAEGIHISNEEGTHSVIMLADGENNIDSFIAASHEYGHPVYERMWKRMPIDVRVGIINDYLKGKQAAEVIKNKATAAQVGDILIGGARTSKSPFITEQPFKDLDPEVKAYLGVGVKKGVPKNPEEVRKLAEGDIPWLMEGFREYMANQVARSVHLMGMVPESGAHALYGTMAKELYTRWKSVNDRFADSPSFDSWFHDDFSEWGARATTYPGAKEGSYGTTIKPERKLTLTSEHALFSKEQANVPKEFKDTPYYYDVQHHEPMMREAFDQVRRPDGVRLVAEQLITGKIPINKQPFYFVQVSRELERYQTTGSVADKKLAAEYLDHLWDWFNTSGTALGQNIEARKFFAQGTRTGLTNYLIGQVLERYKGNNIVPPTEFVPKAKKIIADYYLSYDKAPTGILKNTILRDMTYHLDKAFGSPSTPGNGFTAWYGNVLSGLGTQWINFRFSAQDIAGKTVASMLAYPKDIPYLLKGLWQGIGRGWTEAKATLKGEPISYRGHSSATELTSITPHVNWSGKWYAPLAGIVNLQFRLQKYYPFRMLGFTENLLKRAASEMQAHLYAAESLRKSLGKGIDLISKEDFADLIGENLHNGSAEWKTAVEQATKEWKDVDPSIVKSATDLQIQSRALEIIDTRRRATNPALFEEAKRAGMLSILANKPEGTFGALAEGIHKIVGDIPEARFGFPFVNVATNLMSRFLDYTPVGVVRGALGHNIRNPNVELRKALNTDDSEHIGIDGQPVWEKHVIPWSDVESRQRMATGAIGTAALCGFAGAVAKGLVNVYGYGPKAKGERETWLTQHQPYSVEFNDPSLPNYLKYWKYSETPLSPMLGWLGALEDARKWDKGFARAGTMEQYGLAGMYALRTIADIGPLKTIEQLLQVVNGEKSPAFLVAGAVKGLVPFSGLERDILKFTSPEKPDPHSIKAMFLSSLPGLEGLVDNQLNRFGEPIPKTGRFLFSPVDDKVWKFLSANDFHLSALPGAITISGELKQNVPGGIVKSREATFGRIAANVFTDDEARRILEISGPKIKKRLASMVRETPIPENRKEEYQKLINSIVEAYTNEAKIKVMRETYLKRGQ